MLRLATCSRAVAVATILASGLAGAPAAAIEIFGLRLFEGKREPPPPEAVRYDVSFEVAGDGEVRIALENASRLQADAKEPAPSAAALLAVARGDYQRLLGVLYAQGRYGPTISITVDGSEAASLPPDTELGDSTNVVVAVDPGPQFVFGTVSIENRPGPVPDDETVPKTPEELGLRPGAPARSTAVLAGEAALVGRWREKGYAKAAIARRTADAYHGRDELDVAIAVAPGRPAVFGRTTVSGTMRMDPVFVAYYAGIEPGEPFDPDDLERARDQLRRLEVFQATRIVEADEIGADGALPIELVVVERKRRVVGVGASYSTIDGVGVEGYWRHRNLFGRAEKLNLEARVGGIDAQNPDEYNYRAAVSFLKPGVFTPYTDFSTIVYAEQVAPDTYRSRSVGGRAGLVHRVSPRLTVDAYAAIEASAVDQTSVGDGDFLVASVPMSIAYDGSNDRLDPTQGYRAQLTVEPFYEVNNNNVGTMTEGEASVYYGLAGDRLVLAARAAAGSIVGPPLGEIPANRLFFTGGGGSIRGYPYRGVGPIDAAGNVVGGRSYFTGSLEARVRVTQTIGIVPFMDFGNAFESELPDFSEPLRVGVGAGVRYRTGLGPIRADFAVPLDRIGGDPSFAFYIGIGQAF